MDDRRRADRRQQFLAIRLPDRRRGFPRRTVTGPWKRRYLESLAHIRDNPTVFVLLATLLLALQLADFTLTQVGFTKGAVELNPIMAALFDAGLAHSVKLGVSAVVVGGLFALRRYRPALGALVWMCVGMGALVTYQMVLVFYIA